MTRLEVHLIGRGIISEIPDYVPFQLVDDSGVRHKAVYIMCIAIWNRGKLAITPRDFVADAPLQLQLGADASVVHVRHMGSDEQVKFQIEQLDAQRMQVSFDCINPNHWVQLPIFYTGNPRTDISLTGRIVGQDGAIDQTAREVRAGRGERFSAALALLFIINAVFGTPISAWMIHDQVGLVSFFKDPASVSQPLSAVFAMGAMILVLACLGWLMNRLERRKYPEGYPFSSDVGPTAWENIKGLWNILYKAKKQRVSASVFDWGKPVLFSDKRIKRRSVEDWVS